MSKGAPGRIEKLQAGCEELEALLRDLNAEIRQLSEDELQSQTAFDTYIKLKSAGEGFAEAASRLNEWRSEARAAALQRKLTPRQRTRAYAATAFNAALNIMAARKDREDEP